MVKIATWYKFTAPLFFLNIIVLLAYETSCLGQEKKIVHTYPQAPKPPQLDPLNVDFAAEIPIQPEKFQIIATETAQGRPQAFLASEYQPAVLVGQIKPGSPVVIGNIRSWSGIIFYEVPASIVTLKDGSSGIEGKSYWIPGYSLKATSYNP